MKLHKPKERLRYVLMKGSIVKTKEGNRYKYSFFSKPGTDCPVVHMEAKSRWELIDTTCELIGVLERERLVYADG